MFIFPQITTIMICTIILLIYCCVVGYPIAKKITDKACFELSFPISLALLTVISLIINNIFNVGMIQAVIIWIIPIIISFCIQKPSLISIKEIRQKKCILILPIVMSCIIISALFIKVNGAEITLSFPVWDHVKVAVIDAISRKGLPIENPFLVGHSNDTVFHYYYLWYLLAANVSIIFHISGLSADIILTFITALLSIFVVFFIITENCSFKNRIKAQYISCLLLFSASSTDIVNMMLNNHLFTVMSKEHSLESWIYQAVWVPQHLLSATFVVLSLYLLGTINRYSKLVFLVVISLIVSAFGCSIWVGGVTFCIISVMIFICDVITNDKKKVVLLKWLFISFSSVLLSLPLLYNMLSAPKRAGHNPVTLSIYDTSMGGRFYDFLFFFVGAMPLWITAITISFYVILFYLIFTRTVFKKESKVLIIIGIGSLLTALCFKSQIANNDLGWRAILPFVISGASISSIYFVEFFSEKLRYILFIIASLGLPSSLQFTRDLVYGNDTFHPKTSIKDFLEIKDYTNRQDRLLNNIHENGQEDKEILRANVLPALILNRSFCFQSIGYAMAFGPDWGDDIFRMDTAIQNLYNGKETQQDLNLIKKFKCDKVVVTKSDPIWSKENKNLKNIYSDDKIKIFVIK